MINSVNSKLGAIVAVSVFLSGCASITAPFRDADPRWADYKSWTKVNELEPGTGDPTGFLGGLHFGEEGYRDVYVNDVAKDVLLGGAPYNYPEGSVIVKEQYASQADWEAGRKASHTISVKATASDTLSKEDWIWADSFKGKAGESAFCSGCHSIVAGTDFVFTNGDFLAKEAAK